MYEQDGGSPDAWELVSVEDSPAYQEGRASMLAEVIADIEALINAEDTAHRIIYRALLEDIKENYG